MTTGIIIQAHMGSTRLPGKVLKVIEGFTILDRCVYSCMLSSVDKVVIATTIDKSNLPIIQEVNNLKKQYEDDYRGVLDVFAFSGNEADVLSRYYECAKAYNLDIIVRCTSDCPLLSSEIINMCIYAHKIYEYDYLSFSAVDGLDVEVFTMKTLEAAYTEVVIDSEREHVTPYIYNNREKFNVGKLEDIKFSVDTEKDFNCVKKFIESI